MNSRALQPLPDDYAEFLESLKERGRQARTAARRTVNTELIGLYWFIGWEILDRQDRQGWGAGVVRRLADDLRAEFPEHAWLAVAGATALLVSVPGALTVVQMLGAGVLLWMGASMLRAARSAEPDAPEETGHRTRGGYARGFVTNATNPKALLFFAAILPQFIGHGDGAEMWTVALCATVVLGAGLWWAAAIAVVRLFGFHRSPTAERIVTLLGGIALVLIGAGLLATTVYGLIRPGT